VTVRPSGRAPGWESNIPVHPRIIEVEQSRFTALVENGRVGSAVS
jgi:hypothetical protein